VTGARAAEHVPLVLLPGTLCDARLWAHQTRNLADVAAPSVGDLTRDDAIVAMAERTLEAVPRRFLLVGLSLGAIVAFEITRRAPERVMALALLNTNPAAPDDHQVAVWREEIRMITNGLFAELVEERWIPALLGASGGRGVLLRDTIRGMAHAVGPASYARQLSAQIGRPDSWSSLAAIACPTLVLGGSRDTLCPPALHRAIAAAIPNAQLAIIEDCGHLSACERPEAVTARLRYWVEEIRQNIREDQLAATAGATSLGGRHA